MIQITADTRRAVVTNKELLTVGSAGIQVQFTLSEDWDGLSKLAVFRVGDEGTRVDVVLDSSLICVVPPEVLRDEDEVLFIGIYGTNGQGTVIIPTVWASAGVVKPGTEPNTPAAAEPTPEIWAQILDVAEDAEQTATEAMSAVEAGLQDLSAFENTVQVAEDQRQANEQVRIANETGRVTEELVRSSAENSREVAEAARESNEATRQATEQRRSNYETSWAWERDNFMRDGVSADTLPAGSDATATRYLIGQAWPGTEIPSASTIGSIKFGIPKGDTGEKGDQGDPGDDGVSPTVTVTDITGGHTVTITDADHPNGQSFNVMDGADGQDGADGSDGADGVIQSVNGKSAASITLDSGDIEFDDSETYAAGSIGAEVSNQKNAISQKAPLIINTASGDIATFADGADSMPIKSLVASIEPVQDLHGYEYPWPAGGGVNKLNPNVSGYNFTTWLEYNETTEKYTIKQGNGVAPQPIPINNPISSGTEVTVSIFIESGRYTTSNGAIAIGGYYNGSPASWQGQNNIPKDTDLAGKVYTATITTTAELNALEIFIYGSPTITSNIVFRVQIEIGSTTPTVWHPYANICPISGHTEMTVTRAGKNLFQHNATTQTMNGITFTVNSDGTISLSGTATQSTNYFISSGERAFLNGSFVLSGCPADGGTSTYYLRVDNASGGATAVDYGGTSGERPSFTITDGKIYTVFINVKSGVNTNGLVFKPMIELGSTASEYEPYTSTTIPITFPSTIYGGSDEVIGGALESAMEKVILTGQETYNNNYFPTVVITPSLPKAGDYAKRTKILSNYCAYPSVSFASFSGLNLQLSNVNTVWGVSSADELKAKFAELYASGNPVEAVYPLLQTEEYTLTPNELTTLYGQNNVWTDVGEVSVDYPADTKLYVDNKIAEAVANALNA